MEKRSKGTNRRSKAGSLEDQQGDEKNSAFPAFVVHWTDYSVTRATPLDREVRLAPTETIAMKLADEMITENIKKGWNKV